MPISQDVHSLDADRIGFFRRVKIAYDTIFNPEIDEDAPAQRKWEASVEGPMLIVSVVFLVLFVGAALGKTDALGTSIAELGMWVTWSIFIIDYVMRFILAKHRAHWFWTHLHELIVVTLPWFRPLRVLRIVPILFLVQRFSAKNKRITVAAYTAVGSTLLILVASLSIYDAEYGMPGSHINSFQDAIWWAIVTVTTVGYGDIYPVTQMGRAIGMFLMVGGIAVAGVVTATVAAWLVQQVEENSPSGDLQQNLMAEIVALREEIKTLRQDVETLSAVDKKELSVRLKPKPKPKVNAETKKPAAASLPKAKPKSQQGTAGPTGTATAPKAKASKVPTVRLDERRRRKKAWSALKGYFQHAQPDEPKRADEPRAVVSAGLHVDKPATTSSQKTKPAQQKTKPAQKSSTATGDDTASSTDEKHKTHASSSSAPIIDHDAGFGDLLTRSIVSSPDDDEAANDAHTKPRNSPSDDHTGDKA